MLNFGNQSYIIGNVQVRLRGLERVDADGAPIASVSAPTTAEAQAALNRAAQVMGADVVLKVGSDYRRAAVAAGHAGASRPVEVQAWGTAVKIV